jgi:DNA processing protein
MTSPSSEQDYWAAWSACPGIGPTRFHHLLKTFGSAQAAWQASPEQLREQGIKGNLLNQIISHRQNFSWANLAGQLDKWQVKIITETNKTYPKLLSKADDRPFLLWTKNFASQNFSSPSVAVVGARKITPYGRQVTQKLVTDLVHAGCTIVSGLMYGVDEMAMLSAIQAGGQPVGVWAGGLDTLWGGSRQRLAETVLASGGTLLSEYPLGLKPSAGTFPARNRIVSGLSLGVLVTEAASDSGSLITAGYAAQQGREVFAVPGPIFSDLSQGVSHLLKSGAQLVTSADDILQVLKLTRAPGSPSAILNPDTLPPDQRQIWQLLSGGPLGTDQLVRTLNLPSHQVLNTLTQMELAGLITSSSDKISRS